MRLKSSLKKSLALITLISFLSIPANAQLVEEGKYSKVEAGQPVPFTSWCFDDVATARILSTLEFNKKKCDADLQLALEKQKAKNDLLIDNLNLRISTMQDEHKKILQIKNSEIDNLTTAALKRPNDYTHWWAAGGFFAGAVSVVVVILIVKGDSGL